MIPNEYLPILEPLLLLPGVGQPLYDLLEPDTRILVNLGYGSITEGWNQGPANVPTTFGLFPTIDQTQLSDALSNGWQQGSPTPSTIYSTRSATKTRSRRCCHL